VDPAPTVAISGGGAAWHHQVAGPELQLGAHGFYPGRTVDLETEPSPAVTASGLGSYRAGLVGPEELLAVSSNPGFGEEGWQSPDQPAHAIGASPQTGNGRAGAGEVLVGSSGTRPPTVPAPTVATHPGGGEVTRRKFTIPELRRICGFPDDFALTGSYAQQWERLGRAVPPPMMAAVAATVRDRILRIADDG
jgi:site-specific DNA-cytosine methylase